MGRGMSADNGLRSNVWKEERQRRGGMAGYARWSGAMSIDNGLHLMSGGRRGYRDKKEGWSDEWAGVDGLALTSMKTTLMPVCHAAQTDSGDECVLVRRYVGSLLSIVCLLCLFIQHCAP